MGRPWALISAGVVVILGALFYLLSIMGLSSLAEVPMLTLSGLGVWLLVVSGMKSMEPTKDEVEASMTAGGGALILTIGVVGALSVRGYPLGILIAGFGIVLGFLIVFAALRVWPRRAAVQVRASSG
jgi:hypothetical protein